MSVVKSPRPAPHFFAETQVLSTKKERATPREQIPPRPPVKSALPVSRLFMNKYYHQKAQPVSFKKGETSLRSQHYNESSEELYFDQCFEIECKLGVGSYGEVFKVRSKENGKHYAVKKSREKFRGESDRQRKLEEVKKHEQLPKHRHCVQFIKAWEERQHLYIQTELCETSLSNYSEQNHDIPEKVIWNYLVDLLLAVRHLHDHDLIHLDIKPANIFISKEGICKLGDFGLVLDLKKGDLSEALEGDPKYLAPELMDGKFTKAADIFSLGITILELACDLDLPRGGDCWHQLRSGQIPQDILKKISPELAEIIMLMMHPDPRQRPGVHEILLKPAIHRVYYKRRMYLSGAFVFYGILAMLHWIITMLLLGFKLLSEPFRNLANRRPFPASTPKNRGTKLFDASFSDDEYLEDDSNVSHSSLAAALSDVSSSSEQSFLDMSTSLLNSTPASLRNRAVSTPYKSTGKKLSRTCGKGAGPIACGFSSTSSANKPSFRSNVRFNSQRLPLPSVDFDDLELLRAEIGPKNLLSAFEEIAKEELCKRVES